MEKGINFTQTTSDEELWTGEVLSPAATAPIFAQNWKGKASDFNWRGLTTDGSMAEAGTYKYRLVSEDRAGNRKVAEIANIEVRTLKPALSVIPSALGLSPNGDGKFDDITFDLDCRETRGLLGGKLEFLKDGKVLVASLEQTGKAVFPLSVKWSGKDSAGKILPDGSYSVVFTADYGGRKARAEAPNRILIDTTPPEVKLSSDSLPFSPDNDGRNDTLDVSLEIKDASPLGPWTARILDPSGAEFISVSGQGQVPAKASWDGVSAKGDLVKSAEDYRFEYSVQDALGNETKGRGSFPTDILVYLEGGKYKIRATNIQFAPYTTEYLVWRPEIGKTNTMTLDSVAAMLKKYPAYRIKLEGHAVSVLWQDKRASDGENRYVLHPLSKGRSEAVKQALVQRGVAAARIEIEGFGGDFPIVPFSDLVKRWVDRRVEFILLRN